jgi:hypothetical protein
MLKKGSPFTKSNKKQSKEIHVNADSYNHDMFNFTIQIKLNMNQF